MTLKERFYKHFNFLHHLISAYGAIGVNILIFAFLTPYMLNNLGQEQYGIWQLVSNISMYFSMGSLGLTSAFYLEFSANKPNQEKIQKLINTVFFALLGVSLVSFIVFFVILSNFDTFFIISPDFLIESKLTFGISFFAFMIIFIFGFLDTILFVNHKITTRNLTEIIKICVNGLGSFILIGLGYNIVAIAILSFVCNATQFLYYYTVTKKIQVYSLKFKNFDFTYLKSLYKNGLYFFIYTLGTLIIMNTDNILISHYMGAAFVSLYAVIFRFITISEKFIFVITSVKTPKVSEFISQNNLRAVFDMYKKIWLITLAMSICVAIFLSIFGITVLEFWLGKRFEYDVILIYIFSIFIVIHSLSNTTASFMGILNIMKIQSIVGVVEIIANIGLSIFLFHIFGLRGIALGTLISHVVIGSWYPTWYLIRYLKAKSKLA